MFNTNFSTCLSTTPSKKTNDALSYLDALVNEALSFGIGQQTILYNKYHYSDADLFEIQIPGFSKDQIEIEYDKENRKLNISAKCEKAKDDGSLEIRGFEQKSFNCYLRLSNQCQYDETKISSVLTNGILSITMPFVVPKKTDNVKIKIS